MTDGGPASCCKRALACAATGVEAAEAVTMKSVLGLSLVTRMTLVARLGGLMFGYDAAVIPGAVESIDHYFIDPDAL